MAKKKTELYGQEIIVAARELTEELLDFACSQVRVERTDDRKDFPEPPHGWIVRKLLKKGRVGYVDDGILRGWYEVGKLGTRSRYGLPTVVYARTDATSDNSFVFNAATKPDHTGTECVVIGANPKQRPPVLTMCRYADVLARLDAGISTNALASLRSQIVGTPKEYADSVELLLDDALHGLPSTITTDMLDALRTVDVSVPFDGILRHTLRQTIYAEALRHFGGVTPPQYKAERVQGAEVAANVAESIDNIYIMIEQFNRDADYFGVPYRMEYVGYGARYDVDPKQDADTVPEETPDETDTEEVTQ